MKFSYKARTEEGDIEAGEVEASSKEAALEVIQRYGLYPTSLDLVEEPFWKKGLPFAGRVSNEEIILFARQMSILIGADISLIEGLETIAHQTSNELFKEKLLKAAEAVEGGSNLSDALAGYSDIFSPFYIGMIRTAEKSGRLPEVLKYLAEHLEKARSLRMKLIGAFIYPAFVTGVFFFMMLAMSVFVIPSFEEVFVDMDIELPQITRLVIEASKIMRSFWWLVLLLLGGAAGLLKFLIRDESIKRELDRFLLGVPIIGPVLKKTYLAQLSLNLSTLISSGVSISESLETTAELMGSNIYKEIVFKARKDVRAGKSIVSTFAMYPDFFPSFFVQMVAAGEKTGNLEKTLKSVVAFYEEEVEVAMERLLKFVEPLLIIFLGVLVALLALSLFLPLFQGGGLTV